MARIPTTPVWTHDDPADNVAAVITKAIDSEQAHVLYAIDYSYDSAPTNGSIVININSVDTYKLDVTAAEPRLLRFPGGIYGNKSEALVITLAAGGSGIAGKLNALIA